MPYSASPPAPPPLIAAPNPASERPSTAAIGQAIPAVALPLPASTADGSPRADATQPADIAQQQVIAQTVQAAALPAIAPPELLREPWGGARTTGLSASQEKQPAPPMSSAQDLQGTMPASLQADSPSQWSDLAIALPLPESPIAPDPNSPSAPLPQVSSAAGPFPAAAAAQQVSDSWSDPAFKAALNQVLVFDTMMQAFAERYADPRRPGLLLRSRLPKLATPSSTISQQPWPPPASPTPSPELPDPNLQLPPVPVPSAPTPTAPTSSPPPQPANLPPGTIGVLELTADRQDYDERRQVFTAEGKVLLRFQGAVMDADRLQVNLVNRIAVAEGNVALTRGSQVLRGERLDYNLTQGSGTVQKAKGVIYLSTLSTDTNIPLANDPGGGLVLTRPPSDRVSVRQPVSNVSNPGQLTVAVGVGPNTDSGIQGPGVRRLRFEAENLDFTADGWIARKIDITNDPFSPPELVLRADEAKLRRLSPLRDEVTTRRARLVFDQRVSIPLLLGRTILDRRQQQSGLIQFGYDERDRGGLFAERTFQVFASPSFSLSLTPQVYLQRAIFSSKTPLDVFGGKLRFEYQMGPKTLLVGRASFTSFDPNTIEDNVRASLRLIQMIGDHSLNFEASYRDRLFNGSLGFQTVQSSLGVVLRSPIYQLGPGTQLTYQVGFQNITARTDRRSLLPRGVNRDEVNLSRLQAATTLSQGWTLWRGKPLPATPTAGLRYTPTPLVPYIGMSLGLTGVFGSYSNGDTQSEVTGSIRLAGQFGHFSRDWFDYTAVNVGFIQRLGGGDSPFLFDRNRDRQIITAGISQQIYGPFRIGVQTSYSVNRDRPFSTDYYLEYSRRTYGVILRYNPRLQLGSLSLRISDFNWTGGSEPFAGSDVTSVEGGVTRSQE